MDKATKVAIEKYPHGTFDGEIGDSLRAACVVGYMQAEKDLAMSYPLPEDTVLFQKGVEEGRRLEKDDLALTWEDVAKIITIYEAGIDNGDYRRYNEAEWMKVYSQDILRRFNEIRNRK